MQEFDEVIERRGTGATKWEKYRGLPFSFAMVWRLDREDRHGTG